MWSSAADIGYGLSQRERKNRYFMHDGSTQSKQNVLKSDSLVNLCMHLHTYYFLLHLCYYFSNFILIIFMSTLVQLLVIPLLLVF